MPIRILHFSDFHLDNDHQDWVTNLLSLMIESIKQEHLWLCDEFGDNVEVLHAFGANLNTFSWTGFGGMSSFYAEKIPYFEPLLEHSKLTVRDRAKAEILSIQKDIEREVNNEGYERMTIGEK